MEEQFLHAESNLLRKIGILGYSLETSIQVGPLFIRQTELQKHLGRYAQRLVNQSDDAVYQFQHLGSATGIKYRGRYFAIATDHQRKLGETGELGILCDPGSSVITPGAIWTVHTRAEIEREENLDFCIFEFDPTAYPHRVLAAQFFEISHESGISASVGKIALNLGYPTRLQSVDYYGGTVDLLIVSSFVELLAETTSDDVYLFQTVSEDRYFDDGMSGSPVFEVVRSSGVFRVKWLGIVSRGGEGARRGRVISADFILRQMDRTIFRGC